MKFIQIKDRVFTPKDDNGRRTICYVKWSRKGEFTLVGFRTQQARPWRVSEPDGTEANMTEFPLDRREVRKLIKALKRSLKENEE
ncbi:hypothetical protein SEA_SEPHIROTH_54 [Gordonia Phage Sephiroth]|uniref:Uncharacterized protein n=1 Tax=Gordonia Phage Sephiroth TaxID=2767553 RepID=A0A7G9UZE1_9CAUD|nr:hypothetical protein L3Y23_gp054 [Gordonia Phage Sephiroth]QNN99396.1 hypothetical protein SEA_SEPHIROTH_54 [Gordonia Phage Sephiroth]